MADREGEGGSPRRSGGAGSAVETAGTAEGYPHEPPPISRLGDLEIEHDLEFQRRTWRIQRVGWYAMLALLLAALLGLFGSGPLSHGTAGEPGSPIRLEYERFGRQERETTLRIHLQPGADRVRVWIDRTYLEAIEIKAISPPPERAEAGPHRVGYLFAIADATRPAVITFWVKPQRFGVLSGEVGLDDGTMLRFHQWIYP